MFLSASVARVAQMIKGNTYQREEGVMANVLKKHSISSELAQKMVDEAVAKAKELGVAENVRAKENK